jgi:hypothetical protein
MAGDEHRLGRCLPQPDASYGVVVPVALVECHLAHGREDYARGADRDLRGLLRGDNLDQQVEEGLPVDLANPQVTDVRDDVVLGRVAVLLASARSDRVVGQEALLAELRDRHLGLVGRARLV